MDNDKSGQMGQLIFLRLLATDLQSENRKFLDAWPVLRAYDTLPRAMRESEWGTVVEALDNCYSSVRDINKVARLVETSVIDINLLYNLCFEEVTGYLREKLGFLVQWCGTGLDLAANYDVYELARAAKAIEELLKKLNNVHESHGANPEVEGYALVSQRLEASLEDILADPSKFDVASDNYVGNYVEIR